MLMKVFFILELLDRFGIVALRRRGSAARPANPNWGRQIDSRGQTLQTNQKSSPKSKNFLIKLNFLLV